MTSDFKPGKAYLIKGKDIEQVKREIKEWLAKNNFEIQDERENEIRGYKMAYWEQYDVWLYIKLKSVQGGTLLIFNNKYMKLKVYEVYVNIFPTLKTYVMEWPKNLVRFLLGREELELGYYKKYSYFGILLGYSVFILSLILYFVFDFYVFEGISRNIIFFLYTLVCIILVLCIHVSFTTRQNKLSNLPEYKVEEYKGEIESG